MFDGPKKEDFFESYKVSKSHAYRVGDIYGGILGELRRTYGTAC